MEPGPNGRRQWRASDQRSVLLAAAGLNNAILKIGATDGGDPFWHWGELAWLFIDGNKANQTTPATRTITAATSVAASYVATFTTSAAPRLHGRRRHSGHRHDAGRLQRRLPVASAPSTTTFTVNTAISAPTTPAGTNGTCRRLVNGINNSKPGETSEIHNLYVDSCLDDGIWQSNQGTPMHYSSVSSFRNGGYGFNLWATRPVQRDTPSGDFNGLGLIHPSAPSPTAGLAPSPQHDHQHLSGEAHSPRRLHGRLRGRREHPRRRDRHGHVEHRPALQRSAAGGGGSALNSLGAGSDHGTPTAATSSTT